MAYTDLYPKISLPPDTYALEVQDPSGSWHEATVSIGERTNLVGEIFNWPGSAVGPTGMTFPQPAARHDFLRGRLRRGDEVLFVNPTTRTIFPGRSRLVSSILLAGYGLHEIEPLSGFNALNLQISGAHLIFGHNSIARTEWPTTLENKFSATGWPDRRMDTFGPTLSAQLDSQIRADYASDQYDLRTSYWLSFQTADPFTFYLRSAPMLRIRTKEGLWPANWESEHIRPLRSLISLMTLTSQDVTWASYSSIPPQSPSGGPDRTRSFGVYGKAINLRPYTPSRELEDEDTVLFTFKDLEDGPIPVLDRWRKLWADHQSFIRPLMAGLNDKMPARSRYLNLIQSIEAMHTYTNGEGAQSEEEHRAMKKQILEKLRQAPAASPQDIKWARRWLDGRGRYSLDDRLRQLRSHHKESIGTVVDLDTIPGDFGRVRNEISHGSGDRSAEDLSSMNRTLSALALSQVLEIVGAPRGGIARVFG